MADVALTIIGLGRVGASFGLAMQRYMQTPSTKHRFTLTGYDDDGRVSKEAAKRSIVDRAERDLEKAAAAADIVFIDASMAALERYLQRIGPVVKAGCVIFETAPLKQPPIEWAARYLPESAYLVGLAPVLNPQALFAIDVGLDAASADLFDQGNLHIAASPHCPGEALQLASDLVQLIGLEPHYLDPAEHDGFAAAVRGLPVLAGLALFNTAVGAPSWTDMRRMTDAPFARSTAVLDDDPADLLDLVALDRQNVLHYLGAYMQQLEAMRQALAQADDPALSAVFADASKAYFRWLGQREAGRWRQPGETAPEIPRTGILESLGGFLVRRRKTDDDEADEDAPGKR
jgi:prephenate dehydrogenase